MNPMHRVWLVLSWLGATALVSWLTFHALALADEGVGDADLGAVVMVTTTVTEETAPSTTGGVSPSGTGPTTPTTTATTATTMSGAPTSATTEPAPPTTAGTTTTAPPTTDATITWQVTTVASAGGNVTVRYRPDIVEYQAAVPAPGYDVQVDKTSPEVRVTFAGGQDEYEVRVRWHDGQLDTEIDHG